ncbi:MAG: hypothetical protein KAI47_15135, partial [Deltaproteobacteria bacterium]|nr:hypothetical protein [Deltaproteobacteria bacterium]
MQRPVGPCRRCGGPEIIQSLLRERGAQGGNSAVQYLRPFAITHGVRDKFTFFSERKKGVEPDFDAFSGALVVYVCRTCGHTELYAVAPE